MKSFFVLSAFLGAFLFVGVPEAEAQTACTGWTYSLGYQYGQSLCHRSFNYVQQRINAIRAQRGPGCEHYFEGMRDGWVDCDTLGSGTGGSSGNPAPCYEVRRNGRWITICT